MSESLSQTVARLTSFIKANAPDVDISPGSVFSELVLNLESQVQNQVFSDISDITAANSIQKALTSLTDTYNPVIDEIASNYNTYRNQGTKSSGVIKIYVAVSANYTIPANVVFTQPNLGYTYITTTSTSVGPSTPTPTLFAENNLYYFFVSVQAQNIGQMTVISDGTQFIMSPGSQPTRFVKALAFGAFSAGLNTETDKQLIARFRNGLGSNNLLSQNSIINKFDTLYANFQDAYLADNTSALNNRSISTTLGFKVPGCVDVWVKDGVSIPNVVFTITDATYSSETDSWSITIPSSVAPGFYRVAHVEDANATSINYLPFTITYGKDTVTPNILNTTTDARFSVYQNAVISVPDLIAGQTIAPATNPYTKLPTTNFKITVLAVPDLTDMQTTLLDQKNRIPGADYLVKGIVPCMVNMKISLVRKNRNDEVDVVALQGDIFNYINGLSSGEPIVVSEIVSLCHNYGIARVDLPLVVNGTILTPTVNDTNLVISGTDFLQIPNLPNLGISPNNTMFYISYFDENGNPNINISVN